jgi:CelD/BcsL family acetyltransferase involved in cellulose biosynthesis
MRTNVLLKMCLLAQTDMPLYLQSVLEASPLRSGLLLLPFIVTGATLGVLAGVMIHRTGRFREIMWAGTFLLVLGFGLFISFDVYTSTAKTVGLLMIGGAGSGILFEAPLIAVQSQVEVSLSMMIWKGGIH